MYLKTLTLRGFKSFASATTLHFEPGITCVVGPNGSGKSNVVDALSWVMGEQGAKSLRGGNMADVIFAGTSSRPPLGRAEVSLTIDNSDGLLPIDYTEVTISRTLFRNGGSEYAINGSACRLLDIQELLSDTGMGREMHVIVGQGQLDSILSSTAEDRRAFIEEAAGVLKHRRRKEKALRKLQSMEANLARLTDLVGEIRRQLGPLARQAQAARKAHVVQADLRDARARLLADDLSQKIANLAAERADEEALRQRRQELESQQNQVRGELATLEKAAAEAAPLINEAAEMWFRLSSVKERLRGTSTLAQERIRLLGSSDEPEKQQGRDADDLDRQATKVREAEQELRAEQHAASEKLATLIEARKEAEAAAAAAEKRITAIHRAQADQREGLAKLTGHVGAKRSRLEATEAEIERLHQAHTQALARANDAQGKYHTLEQDMVGAQSSEEDLKEAHTAALRTLDEAEARVADVLERQRSQQTELATWQARVEALELAATSHTDTAELSSLEGISGTLPEYLNVRAGYEVAIAAALGPWADAAIATSLDTAAQALIFTRESGAGSARVLIGGGAGKIQPEGQAPIGTWAIELTRPAENVAQAVHDLLAGVVVVEGIEQATTAAGTGLRAVTRDGDVLTPSYAQAGSGSGPSSIELLAARDEALGKVQQATEALQVLTEALTPARETLQRAQTDVDAAAQKLAESASQVSNVSKELAELGATAASSTSEARRAEEAMSQAQDSRAVIAGELEELNDRLSHAQEEPEDEEDAAEAAEEREARAQEASKARGEETDARLALRTLEERMRAITGRAESLERAARTERHARKVALERAQRRAHQSQQAHHVAQGADRVLAALEGSLELARQLRDTREQDRLTRDETIASVRSQLETISKQHAELTDVVHKDEVARAAQTAKIEQLQQKAVDELGIDPEALVEEYGPHQMVPIIDEEETTYIPFVREEQEKRLKKAERALALLGKVNPLALEEHQALEERHKFLSDQLSDIQNARAELHGIVREIDERVEKVFAEAFADTAQEFVTVFSQLFPGGEGKLVLTNPDDMLTTGIEVHARPPGKKVKRLSLLSGGERSLTAVAMLIAIFKARPSPFYVMDEVEAALDDVNLGRLIEQFSDLRKNSQLIVITHQKRTMEIADALYGVTMRGDGVTRVISQRMEEASTE